MSTGRGLFSFLICLDASKFCIAMCLYSYRDDLPKNLLKKSGLKSGKSPLPFDVRRSKTSLLKLPNMEGRKRLKRRHNSEP